MTIHLPPELERFVHDQVVAGRYSSEDDVVRDALEQLRRHTPTPTDRPPDDRSGVQAAPAEIRPDIEPAHSRRSRVPAGLPADRPRRGTLSETIIRERR